MSTTPPKTVDDLLRTMHRQERMTKILTHAIAVLIGFFLGVGAIGLAILQ